MPTSYEEIHLPSTFMITVGGLTQYNLEKLGRKYEYARQTDEGYPVGGMLKALLSEATIMSDMMGTKIGDDVQTIKIELELKKENVLSKKINNQAKLGLLIPKEEASERVKHLLIALISLIKNAIKNAAPRLINIGEKRDIETILTEEHNDGVELLRKEAKVISWDQDGSTELLATTLAMIEKTDPEFTDIIKNRKSLNDGKDETTS